MSALLDVDEVREHIETGLLDGALQRLIDAADAEIIRKLGALASQTEVLPGGRQYLSLARKASAIISASERYSVAGIGYQTISLTADDYRLLADGLRIERLYSGPTPSSVWMGEVDVTYTPADAGLSEREMLLINLIKLDIEFSAVSSEKVGDESTQYGDFEAKRAQLFRKMSGGGRRIVT